MMGFKVIPPVPGVPVTSSGPVVLATDPFTGTQALSANWTNNDGTFSCVANQANVASHVADALARYSGLVWPADQYSKCTLGASNADGAGSGFGPAVRVDTGGAATCYRLVGNASGWELVRLAAGVGTQLGTGTSPTFAVGDVLYLEFVGSNWNAKKNGVSFSTGSNAVLGSGASGIGYSSTASDVNDGIDTYEGGTP